MKRKYLLPIIFLLLLLLPSIVFGQSDTETAENLLKYTKGDGAFENWFMNAFISADKEIEDLAYSASILGRVIGGLGALLSLGYMGFQMQSGDREWEIMPMIKPIIVGLILMNWFSFYSLIQEPFKKMSEPSEGFFKTLEAEADALRTQRFAKQMALVDYLMEEEAKSKMAEAKESWVPGSETFAELSITITKWATKMEYKFQKSIGSLLEAIGLSILRIGTYLVFFIMKIWAYVLIVLGPIAIGFSLIPGFEAGLNSWIAKFININLYGFIAFMIINLGQILIISAYKMEINRMNEMMTVDNVITEKGKALVATYLANDGMMYSVLFTVVAYVITGIGVLMTPTIADSIVTAGGATVMTKMKGAAAKTSSAGKGVSKGAYNTGAGAFSGAKSGVKGKSTTRGKIAGGLMGGLKGGYNGLMGK